MSSRFRTACSSLCSSLLRAVYIPARVSLPSGLSAPSRRWKWELRPFGLGEQSWGHRCPPGQRGLLGGDPQAQASEYMSWRAGGSEEALGNVPRARVKPLVKEHTLLEGAGKSQAE